MNSRNRKKSLRGVCTLAVLVAAGWFAADAEAVRLRGRILSVGFPSSDASEQDQGYFHYKMGCWVPIRVDLTNEDGDLFNGWMEVRQPDGDGDPVVARQELSIRDSRDYFLYVPGSRSARDATFNIRIFSKLDGSLVPILDERNEKVTELSPGDTVRPLSSTAMVILDISDGGLNHLTALAREPRDFEKLVIARCAPGELPDLVAGLEMADVIVWDAVDPTAIDLHKRQALIEWTRRGGTLVLGVSRNWDAVNRSAFGEFLPAKLPADTQTRKAEDLPADALELLFSTKTLEVLRYPLSYCPLKRSSLVRGAASIVPKEEASSQGDEQVLAASNPCGRGRVVLVAAEMRDLFKVASYSEPFLHRVTLTREATRDASSQQPQQQFAYGRDLVRDTDLHAQHVDKTTDFQVTAGLYFLFAFAFVVAYIVVATVGSWTWLKKQGRVRYSWVVFGALSVAASVTSLLAVRFVRGIGNTVESFTVIDGQAGSTEAGAICFMGLKTATYSNLDLSLPSNWLDIENSPEAHASLRPRWPAEGMLSEGTYKATAEYAAVPFAGQLHDVLFRATAKQFLGRWEGSMAGRLEANLLRKSPTELTDESWIENKLGTDLENCYLFISARGFDEKRYRVMDIYCYLISKLPDGKKITIAAALADAASDPNKPKKPAANTGLDDLTETSRLQDTRVQRMLSSIARDWTGKLKLNINPQMNPESERKVKIGGDQFQSALLLLTLFDELNVDRDDTFKRLDRSEGRLLDRSLAITRDTALFVGFGNDPGPARLCWRKSGSAGAFKPIEPSRSQTMYRITVPIQMTKGQ